VRESTDRLSGNLLVAPPVLHGPRPEVVVFLVSITAQARAPVDQETGEMIDAHQAEEKDN
jgi:hypothetical protein